MYEVCSENNIVVTTCGWYSRLHLALRMIYLIQRWLSINWSLCLIWWHSRSSNQGFGVWLSRNLQKGLGFQYKKKTEFWSGQCVCSLSLVVCHVSNIPQPFYSPDLALFHFSPSYSQNWNRRSFNANFQAELSKQWKESESAFNFKNVPS